MIGCLGHGLAPGERAVLEQTAKLAEDVFAARADGYDRRAAFPAEDFDDPAPGYRPSAGTDMVDHSIR